MALTINEKVNIIYDKLNTKYNRFCEQLTNLFLFIVASFVAYSILYLDSFHGLPIRIFLNKIIVCILIFLIPFIIFGTLLVIFLVQTGLKLNRLLKNYNIKCNVS